MRNASFFFLFIAMMLSAQAQAFDEGGLAYTITSSTSPFTVEVTGRASGSAVTDISIPDTVTNNGTTYSVTTIGYAAFNRNCLVSVTIPDSVTTIGGYAFNESCLTSVTIPDSVESIATGAFFYNNLTSVTIPDSVTTIGEYAFFYNDLTSVTFLGNFGTFELNMFEGNFNLTAITYVQGKSGWPQTFTPAGSGNVAATNTFEQGDLAYLITSGTTVEVTERASGNSATNINIPDTVTNNGTTYSVTTIGIRAFSSNNLNTVTIGNSVTTIGSDAFAFNALNTVTIGNSVTTIESGAFYDNDLNTVTIGNSVTTIGAAAFYNNALTSLTIPDSVTAIGTSAFRQNALTSVAISNSVTTIGSFAFRDNALTSVTFLGNFGTFNLNMFTGNSNLTAITYVQGKTGWPQTFTSAGSGSVAATNFFEQGGLDYLITSANTVTVTSRAAGNAATNVNIPDTVTNDGTTYSVTTIGSDAFYGNDLTSVTIPDSVTTIGDYAFVDNDLTSLTIPDSVTSIGDQAFYFNSLASLTIPPSVTAIGTSAFRQNALTSVTFLGNFGAFNLNMFEDNSNLILITYVQGKTDWPRTFTLGVSGSVAAIPSTFELGDLAYLITSANTVTVTGRASGNSATNINIPDTVTNDGTTYSVTTIGAEAFYSNDLTSVTIPDSVTTIGNNAFNSNDLTTVTIGNSVTTIGSFAFYNNDLTSLTIPDSVTDIGTSAFRVNALTSLTIPDSVTTIGNNAFKINNLNTVTFLGNFGAFNLNMFGDNSNLTAITYVQGKTGWPQTFTPAGSGSVAATNFFEQGGLDYLITSANTVTVTGRASGNSATNINIPDTVTNDGTTYSVTTIGAEAFYNNALTSVAIGNSVTTIGGFAFRDNALTSVTIPDSVESIATSAFYNNNLTSLTLGNGVTTIGSGAFFGNDLNSVTIPDSVTDIGVQAFANNTTLTSVTFLGNFGTFNLDMFTSNPNLTAITYVQGKTGWPQTFSAGSGNVTTTSLPTTPQITYIESDDQKVHIRVSVASNGGSSITRYDAICSDGTNSFAGTSSSTLITVSGLTNGVAYTCTVTATNGVGTSTASSASAAVTPEEMIPSGLPIWLLYEATQS